jgi:hypothetical protein
MNFTLLQHLSASLAERLNISPDELLTALNDLSAMPVHPYEQAKYQIFEKDYKFKTFQELEVPNDFNIQTAQQQLSSFTENYNKTLFSKMSAYQEPGIEGTYNENEIVDIDIAKKSIIFSEAVKTLTVQEIQANPIKVAQKLVNYYFSLN